MENKSNSLLGFTVGYITLIFIFVKLNNISIILVALFFSAVMYFLFMSLILPRGFYKKMYNDNLKKSELLVILEYKQNVYHVLVLILCIFTLFGYFFIIKQYYPSFFETSFKLFFRNKVN